MDTNKRYAAAVIIASDRAFSGVYEDKSGPAVCDWLRVCSYGVADPLRVVPDELIGIQNAVIAALPECDFVVVSGGTGLGPRDLTPQAVAGIADYEVPGLGELLRRESEKYSRNAYLSRCGGWVLGQKLVLAVPGNPKAAVEQLGILEDLLPHVILSLRGECKHRRSPAT